ncbi:MAG: hypothetical protein WCB11_07770 [Terriglobales bacterium]
MTDTSGKQLDAGQAGELIVRCANVMRGYWNNRKETARAFRDGFFRTGDIGHQDSAGYFYILDRLKDMLQMASAWQAVGVWNKLWNLGKGRVSL